MSSVERNRDNSDGLSTIKLIIVQLLGGIFTISLRATPSCRAAFAAWVSGILNVHLDCKRLVDPG